MTIELDHFDVHQKQLYVIIATAIGLSLSHISTILRVRARLLNVKILGAEDWFMVTGELRRGISFMLGSVYTAENLSCITVAYGKSQGSQRVWRKMRAMSLEKR